MKIVTADEMREIDRLTTEKYGVPSLTLMENAGTAVAEFAQKHFQFGSVCVVCGKGNNGGDGFVAARKLKEAGKKVSVIVLAGSAKDLRGDAAEMFKKLLVTPLWISEEAEFSKADTKQALDAEIIVDAILGTGFKPRIQGIPARAVEVINGLRAPVVAVDVPSGVDANAKKRIESDMLVARADGVITFTAPKPVHVFEAITSGPIAVAQIGSPPELVREFGNLPHQVLSLAELGAAFPPRRPEAHKGEFGHVLVIGGSVGKAGAAAMAGMAALASGAGLVTVACPRSVQPTVASFAPEIMTEALKETADGTISEAAFERVQELIEGKDCLAVGPGLSRNPETERFVRRLVNSTSVPVVLDADGLNAFGGHTAELSGELVAEKFQRTLVLTPHPGEMSRLMGDVGTIEVQRDRLKAAVEYALGHKAIVVLKGHRTVVASPEGNVFINITGNPGMAKGGSGDVLTGITAGLLAQHSAEQSFAVDFSSDPTPEGVAIHEMTKQFLQSRDPQLGEALWKKALPRLQTVKLMMHFPLVAAAVCLHGLAGDLSRDLYGEYSMTATQIVESMAEAIALAQKDASSEFAYLRA
jgi:NAD(P)H-hydrate epimerase